MGKSEQNWPDSRHVETASLWVSRELVFEVTAEISGLIEEQNRLLSTWATYLDMSAEDLATFLRRHARIQQLSKELNEVSCLLPYTAERKATNIN